MIHATIYVEFLNLQLFKPLNDFPQKRITALQYSQD